MCPVSPCLVHSATGSARREPGIVGQSVLRAQCTIPSSPRPCRPPSVRDRYTTDIRSDSTVRAAYSPDHAELGIISRTAPVTPRFSGAVTPATRRVSRESCGRLCRGRKFRDVSVAGDSRPVVHWCARSAPVPELGPSHDRLLSLMARLAATSFEIQNRRVVPPRPSRNASWEDRGWLARTGKCSV